MVDQTGPNLWTALLGAAAQGTGRQRGEGGRVVRTDMGLHGDHQTPVDLRTV